MSTPIETLCLKLLASEEQEKLTPMFMECLLNKGIQQLPDVIQFGDKQNQTLKAHIQNVLCFCYQLADMLHIQDSESLNLLAAAYLHDINKFPEYQNLSYKTIATVDNIQKHLNPLLETSQLILNLDYNLIQLIMWGHSGHYHYNGNGLSAQPTETQNTVKDQLIGIIQTADILDLSHSFHETSMKEKALRQLNAQMHDTQLDFTWHYFSDNRGIYTNFIHNVIVDYFKTHHAIPLLFYPEGVWYLKNRNQTIQVNANTITLKVQQAFDQLSGLDTSRLVKDAKGNAFKFVKNPFSLNLSPEKIMSIIVSAIAATPDKKHINKYSMLTGDGFLDKLNLSLDREKEKIAKDITKVKTQYHKLVSTHNLPENWTKQDQTFVQLKPKVQSKIIALKKHYDSLIQFEQALINIIPFSDNNKDSIFSSDIHVLHAGMLVGSFAFLLINYLDMDNNTAWDLSAEVAGIRVQDYPELAIFDKQSNRAFRTAVILYNHQIDFQTITQRYIQYLSESLSDEFYQSACEIDPALKTYISSNFQTMNTPLIITNQHLTEYITSNHKQCSHCCGGIGQELMKGALPDGIKPQLFSNRLKGGGGAPKRNVCPICLQSLFLEKIVHDSYDNHYYLHLVADGGEHRSHAAPNVFIHAIKNGLLALQNVDCRSFLIQPNAIIKEYLNHHLPDLQGSPKKQWGLIIPKYSESICGQITIGINPPGGKDTNDSMKFIFALFHLLMFNAYFNVRGILSKSTIPPLKANEFDTLFIDSIPLSFMALIPHNNIQAHHVVPLRNRFFALYGIRNTFSMDDKDIFKLAKTLSDPTGLELIHFIKKAYAGSERTKDQAPWKQVWPYIQLFIQEEYLMPIKKLAEIALTNHFHGQSFKENAQAKPIDLAFDSLSKHRAPETHQDLKMVILHDVTRGLERLTPFASLKKERYGAISQFVDIFFDDIFIQQYKGDRIKLSKMQKRIRAAFIGYLTVMRQSKTKQQ